MHELLSATDVQQMLDVDRSTVYRMAMDGRIPAVKIGRQWRFRAADIEKLLGFEEPTGTEVDIDKAEKVLDMAAEALGVMMVVSDLEGHPISAVVNPVPRFLALDGDQEALARCAEMWKSMALDPDPRPKFGMGAFGFMCARSIVRVDGNPVAMVLAGGVAGEDDPAEDLFVLDENQRR